MSLIVGLVLLVGLVIAAMPEPAAVILTPKDGWHVKGPAGLLRIGQFPSQFCHVRSEVVGSPDGILYRSWTPEGGVGDIEVTSPPFQAPETLVVAVTGTTRTPSGKNIAFLSCSTHTRRLPIFLGSVNVGVTEAIIRIPRDWCPGETRVNLVAADRDKNVGVGTAYAISQVSALKVSFIGLLPFVAATLGVLFLFTVAGAAAARRFGETTHGLAFGIAWVGVAGFLAFFGHSFVPKQITWVTPLLLLLLSAALLCYAGRQRTLDVATDLKPYAVSWSIGALLYFALLLAGGNHLGHWDPNYRFWPATWSSDNELPWMFAEAVRNDGDLAGLYGGGWKPTDQPPLMAGLHLLVSDFYTLLRLFRESKHLHGATYNAVAVALSASWIPAVRLLLTSGLNLDKRSTLRVLTLIGLLPFAIFNSIYGWPKALGACFGLGASATAIEINRTDGSRDVTRLTVLFGVLCALSLLAHTSNALFLAPLGGWLFVRRLRSHPRALFAGATAGLALLFAWTLYQTTVLPSHGPIIRYALTGDHGFSEPTKSLAAALVERYADLGLLPWLETKVRMLVQPILPLSTSIVAIGLSSDFATDSLGTLRAWDTIRWSAGNSALLIGIGAALMARRRIREPTTGLTTKTSLDSASRPELALVVLVLVTWLLLALLFMTPLILPHWPHTAIYAVGVGGLAALYALSARAFVVVSILTFFYVSIVWVIAPLHHVLQVDWIALSTFAALVVALLRRVFTTSDERIVSRGPPSTPSNSHDITTARWWSNTRLYRWTLTRRTGARGKTTVAPLTADDRRLFGALIASLIFASVLFFALTASRPLTDDHSFRQTQTAISTFYMLLEGHWIRYITPVLGAPWAIPYEAPIYQWSVALFAWLLPLELAGRLVGLLYMLGAVLFGYRLVRHMSPPNCVAPMTFAVLALAAPLHVFWGRAFLVESCALFFGTVHLYSGVKYLAAGKKRNLALCLSTGALCALAKSTTWPAFVVALALCAAWTWLSERRLNLARTGTIGLAGVLILGGALLWTTYSDALKIQSVFGSYLTSASLQPWNFGSLSQRFSRDLWDWTIRARVLPDILGILWLIAALPLAYALIAGTWRQRIVVIGFVIVFLFPILTFTNLHLVHNYYQMANAVFLLLAVAFAIGVVFNSGHRRIAVALTLVIALGQVVQFQRDKFPKAFSYKEHDQILVASRWVRDYSRPNTALLAFGVDWSPIAHHYSQRKGIAFAPWFSTDAVTRVLDELPKSLGGLAIGSIIDCRAMAQGKYPEAQNRIFDDIIQNFQQTPGVIELVSGDCVSLARR